MSFSKKTHRLFIFIIYFSSQDLSRVRRLVTIGARDLEFLTRLTRRKYFNRNPSASILGEGCKKNVSRSRGPFLALAARFLARGRLHDRRTITRSANDNEPNRPRSFCRRPINTSRVEISERDIRACPRSSFREGWKTGRWTGWLGGEEDFPLRRRLLNICICNRLSPP